MSNNYLFCSRALVQVPHLFLISSVLERTHEASEAISSLGSLFSESDSDLHLASGLLPHDFPGRRGHARKSSSSDEGPCSSGAAAYSLLGDL